MNKIAIFTLAAALFFGSATVSSLSGCSQDNGLGCKGDKSDTAEAKDSRVVARQQSQYAKGQPIPMFLRE